MEKYYLEYIINLPLASSHTPSHDTQCLKSPSIKLGGMCESGKCCECVLCVCVRCVWYVLCVVCVVFTPLPARS